MKIEAQNLIDYHCPRWNELPEIELYIDQVICVLPETAFIAIPTLFTRSALSNTNFIIVDNSPFLTVW